MTSKLGLATQARFSGEQKEINRGPQEKARLPSNTKPEFREGPPAAAKEKHLPLQRMLPHASNPIAFATISEGELEADLFSEKKKKRGGENAKTMEQKPMRTYRDTQHVPLSQGAEDKVRGKGQYEVWGGENG